MLDRSAVYDKVLSAVQTYIGRGNELPPTFIFFRQDNPPVVLSKFFHMRETMHVIAMGACQILGADEYFSFMEGWSVASDAKSFEEAEQKMLLPPSEHPDRKEIFIASRFTKDAKKASLYSIRRVGSSAWFDEISAVGEGDQIKGDLASYLDATPAGEVRETDRHEMLTLLGVTGYLRSLEAFLAEMNTTCDENVLN